MSVKIDGSMFFTYDFCMLPSKIHLPSHCRFLQNFHPSRIFSFCASSNRYNLVMVQIFFIIGTDTACTTRPVQHYFASYFPVTKNTSKCLLKGTEDIQSLPLFLFVAALIILLTESTLAVTLNQF